MVKDPDVEAVYVATPNSLHYENCRLCLEHGKHVLCEKPFTINEKQAQELYRLAKDKHIFIMEGLWIWFLPLYNRLRNILLQGTIGEIKHISCQYGFVATGARKERKFNSALGGGALLDIGIYNLGFLRIVTGCDPQNVETTKVHINENGTDDYSCLKLTYNDGCIAESVQTIGEELKRNARIEGTKGSIFLPDFQHAKTLILEVDGKEPETIECSVDINGFEYEIREVAAPDIDTIFLNTSLKYAYLSSSIVKEMAMYGGDISKFVPACIIDAVRERYSMSYNDKPNEKGRE